MCAFRFLSASFSMAYRHMILGVIRPRDSKNRSTAAASLFLDLRRHPADRLCIKSSRSARGRIFGRVRRAGVRLGGAAWRGGPLW